MIDLRLFSDFDIDELYLLAAVIKEVSDHAGYKSKTGLNLSEGHPKTKGNRKREEKKGRFPAMEMMICLNEPSFFLIRMIDTA